MKRVLPIVTVICVIGIGILNVAGQQKTVDLMDRKVTLHMTNKPLFDVLKRLIYDYDVAIGFEESLLDKGHNDYHFEVNIPYDEVNIPRSDGSKRLLSGFRPYIENHLISVNYENAELKEVFNDIVKQMKNYDWEINEGVVNIYPINGRSPKFEKLLDLRIREFVVSKGAEVGIIQPLIVLQSLEFRTFLAENKLYAESDRLAPWYIERPLPSELRFSNLTLKELLNAITKNKRGGWILRTDKNKKHENKGKEFIEILI